MPMESQMMRWNRCENKLAVICGTVSSEMTSMMPTMRRHATMVSAMNIISAYFEYLHRNALRAGKLPVESHVDDRMEIQCKKQYQQQGKPTQ